MAAKTYKTISGDTWDGIAKKMYGNEMAVSFLMSNNQPLLSKYFVFPAGVRVTIMDPPEADDGMPLWRF